MESSLSLSELNRQVKSAIRDLLPGAYWLRAETSDVRSNQSGHCYLEFVEKDKVTQSIVARARGVIWANVYRMLSPFFEQETGQPFVSGLSVLVRVTVDFHELYGYSLTVVDIDPSFTLGEMARNRQRVLKQLETDGVLTLNKELEMPELANRVAVISSPTAAGYEDFKDQLANNPGGIVFYSKLFPAVMQGERSEESIIAALEKIYQYKDLFDVVAIIRGGGASSELSTFDSYHLASNVAQFPLPVISGIGHERDVTVLDVVAHTRGKTPTAVAEILIARAMKTASELLELEEKVVTQTEAFLLNEQKDIMSLTVNTRYLFMQALQKETADLQHTSVTMRRVLAHTLQKETASLQHVSASMKRVLTHALQKENHLMNSIQQLVQAVSPENVLKRGYTLSLKGGKVITSLNDVREGDVLETRFKDGTATSVITGKK